jgi:CBS domain-containing protein
MQTPVPSVTTNALVGQVAALMVDGPYAAIPVIDSEGALVGLVTQSDLVVKHANVHGPTYLGILGGIIHFESRRRDEEMRRALGVTAGDVMSTTFSTIGPDDDVDDAATAMVDSGDRTVVVVADAAPIGLLSESDIVRLLVAEERNDDDTASA